MDAIGEHPIKGALLSVRHKYRKSVALHFCYPRSDTLATFTRLSFSVAPKFDGSLLFPPTVLSRLESLRDIPLAT
jgi:hypothetical protein